MRKKSRSFVENQEISLRLDIYDDIFSDFDIRSYEQRALSTDFLSEIQRASQDKKFGEITLALYLPEKKRSSRHEVTIKERLAAHFNKHYHLLAAEKKHLRKFGFTMVFLGALCMIAATLVMFFAHEKTLVYSFLIIFLEPAGWFLLWEGMDLVIFHSKRVNPELDFYHKMSELHGDIHFLSHK